MMLSFIFRPGRRGTVVSLAAGCLLAIAVAFVLNVNALGNLVFHLGVGRGGEQALIADTIKQFNKLYASFYDTGGSLNGLNDFPAANLVKRRIFQDIAEFSKKNELLVHDRDETKLLSITFIDAMSAEARTSETWFLSLQDAATRKPLSGVKSNQVKVRYLLKRGGGVWRVVEFEVFGKDDPIPSLPIQEF